VTEDRGRLRAAAAAAPDVARVAAGGALALWQRLSEAQGRGRGDRELAILFTDLEGYSTWALEAGDTLAVELLRRVNAAAEPAIAAHGGRVVKSLGDGLMATFLDAESAVVAAVEARDAVAQVRVGGHAPRQRAGVHVGRPRRIGGDYLGIDVNVAARVAEAAKAGEVLVSDAVCERLGEGVSVKRRWRMAGKGTPSGTKVFSVEGVPDADPGSGRG
jgi:adenylate cyclase